MAKTSRTIDEALPTLRDVNQSEQENLQNASSLGKVCVRNALINLSPSVFAAFWSDRGMKNEEEPLTFLNQSFTSQQPASHHCNSWEEQQPAANLLKRFIASSLGSEPADKP